MENNNNNNISKSHATVFITVALVFVALLAMYQMPAITIGDYTLREVKILSDIDDLRQINDKLPPLPEVPSVVAADSSQSQQLSAKKVVTAANDIITDYSGGNSGGLGHFYQCLDSVETMGRPVRIAYYGDSFIEGDILTADIRDILQQRYGGYGVGWVDCAKGTNAFRPTVRIVSDGFIPHLTNEKPFDSSRQGINQKYYTLNGHARLTYKALTFRGRRSTWQKARLWFTTQQPMTVTIGNDSNAVRHEFQSSPSIQYLETNGRADAITYNIEAGEGTTVFGASLEPVKGIVVDNLGLRGLPGFSLAKIPDATLRQFYRMRPYDLIIIHYGINCAADGNPESFYKAYVKKMTEIVEKIKRACPGASIMVCNVSDRDQRSADGIRTMNAVKKLARYQRQIASESGVAFFDLFNAMGGDESMAKYVEKGWANKDYIHINFEGGKHLAEIVCKELLGVKTVDTQVVADGEMEDSIAKTAAEEENHVADSSLAANSNLNGEKTVASTHDSGETATSTDDSGETATSTDVWQRLTKQLTYDKASPLIFSSGLFMAMFVVFTLFYYMLSGKTTAKLMFVTLFSYYFYYKSSGLHFVLLAAVTTTDYLIARWMARATKGRGALLSLSILTDLGLLFYFKYTNFFGSIFAGLSGCQFTPLDIVLPVGISFFTFQSMSYTIDVYRRRLKPVGSWLDYAFYVSFFPQLVAGPIVRARDFIPQIRRRGGVSETMMARGVMMIAMGLAKKAIISDYISLNFVDRVFENPQLYTGFENLLGIYGYTLQIYCDFSGYSDMAIGIALLLGFHFPDNFNAPFKSASVTEFWRRWHISLSSWIRDYVYIAFGGNRHGSVRTYTNLLSSMLLCGLWHGASWNFVVWGGVHGVLLAFHKFFSQTVLGRSRHYRSRGIRRVAGVVLTFHAVALLFMVFRMPDLGSCMTMLSQIVGSFHAEMASEVMKSYWIVMALMAFGYASHYISNRFLSRCVLALKSGGLLLQVFVLVVVAYIIVQVKSSEIQPFIYFQF